MGLDKRIASAKHTVVQSLGDITHFFGAFFCPAPPFLHPKKIDNQIGYNGSKVGCQFRFSTEFSEDTIVIGFETIQHFINEFVTIVINTRTIF